MKEELTQEQLKKVLHYDPDTGMFTWRVGSCNRIKVGDIAGGLNGSGYMQVKFKGCLYQAHRLAFLYMTGSFPPDQVDHINHVRDDNRWVNLRKCTRQQNTCNSKKTATIAGYKGVTKHGKKWQARIKVNEVTVQLGTYDSPEQAAKVYENHAKKLFGEFAYIGGEQ